MKNMSNMEQLYETFSTFSHKDYLEFISKDDRFHRVESKLFGKDSPYDEGSAEYDDMTNYFYKVQFEGFVNGYMFANGLNAETISLLQQKIKHLEESVLNAVQGR